MATFKLPNVFGDNRQLRTLAGRYNWTAAVVSVLAMAITLMEGLGVGLLIPFLGTLAASGVDSHASAFLRFMETIASKYGRMERLEILTAIIGSAVVAKAVLQISAYTFLAWTNGRIRHDIRCSLSKRLNLVGYSFYQAQDPKRLFQILSAEAEIAADAVRVLVTQIATGVAVAVFGVLLLFVSWKLTLLVLLGSVAARLLQRRMERLLQIQSRSTLVMNQLLNQRMLFEVFSARLIRIFNTQTKQQVQFENASDGARLAVLKSDRLSATYVPLLEAMHGGLLIIVLLAAVLTGISLPVLAAFLLLMTRMQPHLRVLEETAATFAAASAHFSEVDWLLDDKDKPVGPQGQMPFDGLRDAITFKGVTFNYPGRSEPALTHLNFTLRKGTATALLGESGAGKSTVVNLLCRLLEPTSGTILADGESLNSLDLADWLSHMAVAGQDIELIDGTIAANISYGREHTERWEIEQATQAAQATFIQTLPLGLDTPVGPNGLSLSGGQRQRIGLARALARKPKFLILDEATNAVDHDTEESILNVLKELRGQITILVISHKSSTLAICDAEVRLGAGRAL